jgi:hypothetical protein
MKSLDLLRYRIMTLSFGWLMTKSAFRFCLWSQLGFAIQLFSAAKASNARCKRFDPIPPTPAGLILPLDSASSRPTHKPTRVSLVHRRGGSIGCHDELMAKLILATPY